MNWLDLVCFVPLAVLCNTVVPIPFDPVLIFFASRQPPGEAQAFALVGSVCAGVAAAFDVTLFRRFRQRTPGKWLKFLPNWDGRRAYVLTFLFALLPLPFSIVRLAVLRNPPRVIPYQVSVALGRLPRYVATVVLWQSLKLPAGSGFLLLVLGVAIGALQWSRSSPGTSQHSHY
jgi:uncharacterized membrane protein YdjX (TVP38/TMEM64 family)